MDKQEKIWCICGGDPFFPIGISKIIDESKEIARVQDNEKQMYPLQDWDPKYLGRYQNITDAIKMFAQITSTPLHEVKKSMIRNFPSQRKEISLI